MIKKNHGQRMNKEEKAKVVAAVWGKKFIQFLAAIATFHLDDLKKRMICTRIISTKRMNSSYFFKSSYRRAK